MEKSVFLLLMTVFCACSSSDSDITGNIGGNTDKLFAAVSPEEAISILPYNGENISADDIFTRIEEFAAENITRSDFQRNNINKLEIIDEYSLDTTGVILTTKSLSPIDAVSFAVARFYDVDDREGVALVCSDERFPEVLAFVPDSKYDAWNNPMARLMVERAQDVALAYIKRFNVIRDSLREETIHKVCVQLDIAESEFDIERYMKQIFVIPENRDNTESSVEQNPGGIEISHVGPLCGETRLIQGWPCNQFIQATNLNKYQNLQYNGHFPVGCVNVALATMCSYIKPTVYSPDLGRVINWDNVYNSYFNPWGLNPAQYDENTPQAIEVGHLMKILADGTETEFSESLGGNTDFVKAVSYMNSIGVNMGTSFVALNYGNVRNSLGADGLVYVSGTETSKTRTDNVLGGHSWVIDGVQTRTQNTRIDVFNYNCYANCKFGWIESANGTYNGWYLFDTAGTITFDFGSAELATDLKCITNIKK